MRNYSTLTNLSKWRLASAYLLIGRKDVAQDLIYRIPQKSVNNYNGSSPTFGSAIRDKAIILDVLTLLEDYDECTDLMKVIANELGSDNYMNTQTTAYSLMAITKFVTLSGNAKSFSFDLFNFPLIYFLSSSFLFFFKKSNNPIILLSFCF